MPSDVRARPIVWSGLAIGATVAVAIAAVFLLLRHWELSPAADRTTLPYRLEVPGPRLQTAPQFDLARYRAEQRRQMEATQWVDRRRGVARFPVAAAMQMLAASAARGAAR